MFDQPEGFKVDDTNKEDHEITQKDQEARKSGYDDEKIREEVRRMTVTKLHRRSIGNSGHAPERTSAPPRNLSVIRYIEEDDNQKCCACRIF